MAGHHKLDRTGQDEHNNTKQDGTKFNDSRRQSRTRQDKTKQMTEQDETKPHRTAYNKTNVNISFTILTITRTILVHVHRYLVAKKTTAAWEKKT